MASEEYLFYMLVWAIERRLMTFRKIVQAKQPPPFGVFLSQPTVTILFRYRCRSDASNRYIRFWGVEQTDMGLKTKGLLPSNGNL
jgi:hypothetical protein